MRKPNQDDLSDDVADTGSVGDGFSAVVDFSDSYYGDSFDDDYSDQDDGSTTAVDTDDSFADESSDGVDADAAASGEDVTEAEAEVILEDMLEETYGPNAGEMVDSLEESTGMSATEILEDITGMDLGGSEGNGSDVDAFEGSPDGGVGSVDPFAAPDTSDDFDA